MAGDTVYFTVDYDNEASGPFVAKSLTELTWTASSGFVVNVFDDGATGRLVVALISGSIPTDNLVLTQGSTTADANGNGTALLYPAFARDDYTIASSGAVTWAGPALGVSHSFLFDGQTANVVAGEILTFSPGNQQCEVITVVSDAGASGELDVRWITPIDTLGFPDDNDTFSGDIAGDGALDGVVHPRAYAAIDLHRFASDIASRRNPQGNDLQSIGDATPTRRRTDEVIELLTLTVNDTVVQHMYGGSLSQSGGATLYSGLAIQVTDPTGLSEPVVIQDDAIVTEYWGNAFMPDSVIGKVRIMRKTREDGVDIDAKRIRASLLELGDIYFHAGTTLGTGEVGLALVSSADGNNTTPAGTLAGAPYNTVTYVEGYQEIDYNNGSGLTPFGLKWDVGTATKAESYEKWKYDQRRGTAATFFGRNAQLLTGINATIPYDTESANFSEDEQINWGTILPYTGEASGPFTVGEVVLGSTSGARGRILYLDDQGTTGTIIVDTAGAATSAFSNTETITGQTSGATATTGTVTNNSAAGTMVLIALDDDGTTGNLYGQLTRGFLPANNQAVYGTASLSNALVNGTAVSRVINNQAVGVFTGSDFQTNFGIALDTTDATAGDDLRNLLDVVQEPPNNQTGTVTGGNAGDYITAYPWDGVSTDANGDPEQDFDEMTLDVALTGGVSTTVDVNAIPANTPAAGFLRVERDSDGEYDLLEYVSFTGSVFTLGGSTPTAPNNAAISNNAHRAFIDKVWTTTGVPETYQAVQTTTNEVVVTLRRGSDGPIVTFKGTTTFGAAGFNTGVQRIADD